MAAGVGPVPQYRPASRGLGKERARGESGSTEALRLVQHDGR